jgi:hypothetical protein
LNSQPLLIDNYVYLLFRTWYIASWSCTSTECAVIVSVGMFDTSMNLWASSAVLVVVVSYCWVGRISMGGCTTTDLPCSCCTIKNYHTASSVQFLLLWYHNIVGLAGVESAWGDAPTRDLPCICCTIKNSHTASSVQFFLLWYHNIVGLAGGGESACTHVLGE